ncbi:MAG: hypothetical protein D6796_11595 [Caldilineae bacterium]|nr:MAG: hypothetical protein D6796_11595 [Caldilineae bacterium]
MATEPQLTKVFNIAMYSMIKGMWDLFGDTATSTVRTVGHRILETLETQGNLTIQGDNPEAILQEVARVLAEEVGTMAEGTVQVNGNQVSIACRECFLREATGWLEAEGIEPFACLPMNIAAAAMQKQLGLKHRLRGRTWDDPSQTCTIQFEIVS